MRFSLKQFSSRFRGFTLVEMMVSVALVVVLMLAITQIFSITSKTMGGSQAISAALRDAQAVQAVMQRDFGSAVIDGAPCFVINSSRMAAPRNLSDAAKISNFTEASNQFILTEDRDGDGVDDKIYPPGAGADRTYSPLQYNHRNHRVDTVLFFARNVYERVTGGLVPTNANDPMISDMISREAAIFYHHLQLPNQNGQFTFGTWPGAVPGAPSNPSRPWDDNPNNYFASQWILGRVAMLMVPDDVAGNTPGDIKDRTGKNQSYFAVGPGILSASTKSKSNNPLTGSQFSLPSARFDLVNTSIDGYRAILQQYITDNPNLPLSEWWRYQMCELDRFQANPFMVMDNRPSPANPSAAQINSINMAKTTPIFLPACSQFIVEFAGDFITQNWDPVTTGGDPPDSDLDRVHADYGKPPIVPALRNQPDGRIDTVFNSTSGSYTGQIRWYGFPRDTNDDGRIVADDGDVVPVCNITSAQLVFERVIPTTGSIPATDSNYLDPAGSSISFNNINFRYVAAWGPAEMANPNVGKPKLIRITIVIDKPEADGKLPDGQVFEYVFKVGQ